MNAKRAATLFCWALSIAAVCAVLLQRQQLIALQAQREQIAHNESLQVQTAPHDPNGVAASQSSRASTESVSPEVLRLRSEITRLNARKRELANVTEEGEGLRARLATAQAEAPTEMRLPPGYIRKAQAQFAGYSTPENTIQSFLWALQRHDVARFLQALLPEEAQSVSNRLGTSGAPRIFQPWDVLPGMAVESRQDLPDGTVELQVAIGPGMAPQKLQMRLVDGEWKLNDRF